jgi:pre-mRNA-processing factor 6
MDMPEKKKSHLEKARRIYQEGLEKCPSNVTLWILASRLEEMAHTFVDKDDTKAGAGVTKARSLLELARLKTPKNDNLWLEAIRLERRSSNPKLAESLMARALQECPKSGALLAENILTAPRVEQKSKSADAIKRNPESPLVIAAVATLFASDRKTEKARKWFERAVMLNPDLGDSWARYYVFELDNGADELQTTVRDRCIKAEPKHGELWQATVKDMSNRHKSIGECLDLVANKIKRSKK